MDFDFTPVLLALPVLLLSLTAHELADARGGSQTGRRGVFSHPLPPPPGAGYRRLNRCGFLVLGALVLTRALFFLRPAIDGITNVLLAPASVL